MKDKVDELLFHKAAIELWDACWNDCNSLSKDFRGKEIAKQLIRSCGSISANIEEGYGRGYGKEYPYFLKIARGSARETKGWYQKSKFVLNEDTLNERFVILDKIIAMLTKTINTLESK